MTTNRTAISLFSGAGGDTCGLEAAGWTVSHFSEFAPAAIQTHLAAFPQSIHLVGEGGSADIRKIPDSVFESLKGRVGLLFGGFPCFVKGTLVLTDKGYLPIETISLEEKLLTHTGAFHPIVNLQRKIYTGNLYRLRIKYHPTPIIATEEHPFYVREKRGKGVYSEPIWKRASELGPCDYFGMPVNTKSEIPEFTFPRVVNNSRTVDMKMRLDDPKQWFMMGYFVGDGWAEDGKKSDGIRFKHTIRFCIADKDRDTIFNRLQTAIPELRVKRQGKGCFVAGCGHLGWWTILKKFGKYAHGKRIPEWVQDAPVELIREFLAGYAAADGNPKRNAIKYTTVSPHLAFGTQRLYLKLGVFASVQKTSRPNTYAIEGRTVNQRDTYDIVASNGAHRFTSFIENGYAWFAPAKLEIQTVIGEPVYNFEVAEDNSYCVENVIVHNCQGFSHAGKKKQEDPRNELVHELVRTTRIIQPTWVIGENVRGLLSRKGVYPAKTAPRPVIEIIRELFEGIGYKTTWHLINATRVGVPQKRERLLIVAHRGDLYPHLNWDSLVAPAVAPSIRAFLTGTLEGAVELPATPYKPAEQPARFWISTTETTPTGTPHPYIVRLVAGIRNLGTREKQEKGLEGTVQIVEPGGLISFGVRKSGHHGQVLDPDGPSKTIICAYNQSPRLYVGLHNAAIGKYWVRCLTVEECAQIQGFPATYPWQGTPKEKITQIGNAVPPPLATAVAKLLETATFAETPQLAGNSSVGGSDSEDEE